MGIRVSKGERVFALFNFSFLTLLTLVILYPLFHVAFASFSDPNKMVGYRGILLAPKGFSLQSYELVLSNPMILSGYLNTLFILVIGTSINMVLTIIGAFVLTRKNLLFKNFFIMFILITMLFQGGLIPLYRVVYSMKLANTLWAMILPVSINTWNLIVMRSFFATIPDSLEESAKIDGANDLVILIKIILPLSLPVLAVIGLFYGVYHWNAWFNAMIYTRNRALYPLQLILREILIANDLNNMMSSVASADQAPIGATIKYATIMVSTVPILFCYPFLQRFFVKGLVVGAVKG